MENNARGRTFPDINFVDMDTERLTNAMIAAYEMFTSRTLHPADPVRVFILWIADIIMQERVIIDASAKQNVPRFAEGEYLDSLAELFRDTERLQPTPARTTFRFHISAPRPSAHTIPRGTRVSVDGNITFATEETVNIPRGELYGDARAVCITTEPHPVTGEPVTIGARGNGFIPGEITQIVDVFPFYERVENITTSEGGTDVETDPQFYERLRDSMESFSTAGSIGAYIYWVKTASQLITDVKPTTPEPGVVDIRVLLADGEYPDEEMIGKINRSLDGKVPLTDKYSIAAPDTRPFGVDITYYIPRGRADSTASIRAAAERAVDEYICWQTERMGRDINPDELTMLMRKAGVKRIDRRSPAFEVIEENEVAALVKRNVLFGGLEDE